MSVKKDIKVLILLIGVLIVCLMGSLLYTYNFYQESKENTATLEIEKEQLEQELAQLNENYQHIKAKNATLKKSLEAEQTRIAALLDSLENMNSNYKRLRKYKVQADLLKLEKQRLFDVIDSLSAQNEKLRITVDSTSVALQEREKHNDSLGTAHKQLSEKIEKASQINITRLKAEAIVSRNRNNKSPKTTQKTNRAEAIQTCFTLVENQLAEKGEKKLFVQIINPKNNMLGKRSSTTYKNQSLIYSKATVVNYINKEQDVCVSIPVNPNNLVPGQYVVNVFHKTQLVSTTSFELH